MKDAIWLVSQTLPFLGGSDSRLGETGNQYFRLRCMISARNKEDNPPARVKQVPMLILIRAAELCGDCNQVRAVFDCIWKAFYFLQRPGEYANTTGDVKRPF